MTLRTDTTGSETENDRTRALNARNLPQRQTCVLYVMSRDQRIDDNHALVAAQKVAMEHKLPLAVVFVLLPRSGQRAREHYQFMLTGLLEIEASLAKYNIPFLLLVGDPRQRLHGVLHHLRPIAVYFDFSPLRGPQTLHQAFAKEADCPVYEVDTHNVVPVWKASDHQEVGARTLRPKIHRLMAEYIEPADRISKHPYTWPGTIKSIADLQSMIDEAIKGIPSNGTDISRYHSGEKAAEHALSQFMAQRLKGYADNRNDPSKDGQSDLSPYLHYGQLSAARIVRAVQEAVGDDASLRADADALIEELVVRKELSDNFCFYNPDYDRLSGAPEWARRSLHKHASDTREFTYSRRQLEMAQTHDTAWNAAQRQLTRTGKIHGYMRMYWAKKVLEWSQSPEEALEVLLYMNDFYHIDGGDPNGYVGILWSIAGVHDRPWGERPVYGVVRSMVYTGLKRKFDVQAYEAAWPAD